MDMQQIAEQLEIEAYPEILNTLCEKLDDAPACDLSLIADSQEKYNAFGDYYDYVLEGAKQINEDPVYSAWVKTVSAFLADPSLGSYRDIPVLALNGTPKRDMAMLMTLVPFIPYAAATYTKGGFSPEETASYIRAYGSCMTSTKTRSGFVGLDKTYFMWLHHFAFAEIFRVHGIQFEFSKIIKNSAYLRNKISGEILPMMYAGQVHASGRMLVGAGGYKEEEGSFIAEFTETEDSYIGYGVYDHIVDTEKKVYPKTHWELLAKAGDKALSMHLPRGADIREENVRKACAAAREVIKKCNPDYENAPIYCSSWLLDPGNEEILGSDSNVVRFGKLFARIPTKSAGRAANGFVFPGKPLADADLPEDTRLQRGLKERYLSGGYSYAFTGILVL